MMNESSSALREPTLLSLLLSLLLSRLQSLATIQFTIDRRAHEILHGDDLLGGSEMWQRRTGYGTFAVRLPSEIDPGYAGWHIDGSFGEPPWYRVNFTSRGGALLLLMLFSVVTEVDAPTRIKAGSHRDMARTARTLSKTTDDGVAFVPHEHAPTSLDHDTVLATGRAGDVYLCHPSLCTPRVGPTAVIGPSGSHSHVSTIARAKWDGAFDYDDLANDSPVKYAVRAALHNR